MKLETIEQLAEKLAAWVPCYAVPDHGFVAMRHMTHFPITGVNSINNCVLIRIGDNEILSVNFTDDGWEWHCREPTNPPTGGYKVWPIDSPTKDSDDWSTAKLIESADEMRESLSQSVPVHQGIDFGWGERSSVDSCQSAIDAINEGYALPRMTLRLPQEFIDFCEERGIVPHELIAGFIGDLCGLEQRGPFNSHGSDERRLARDWFDRVDWTYAVRDTDGNV